MAGDRHDDLDDLDEDSPPEIVVDDYPQKKSLNLKPILTGLLVLVLGGGLGGAVYLFSNYEIRDLIGLLDIADSEPRLSMSLPGKGEAGKGEAAPAAVAIGGGLLTPPGVSGRGDILKAIPDDTPPADAPPPNAPSSGVPPPAVAASPPPASSPDPEADALARLEAGSAPPPPAAKAAPVDASGIPTQPSPRTADKPPTFDQLAGVKGDSKPLPPAPAKDLLRKTQAGDLPFPGPDGRQPWQVYSRPWSGPADKGKVAVVVVDLGLDKAATEAAIAKLPPEVTLAFSPYAPSLDKWVKKARDFGHEVLLVLPAEASGYPNRDPGPYGLLTSLSPESNLTRLETVMAKAVGYAGLVSLGGLYAASPQMAGTLGVVRDHGLMFIGSGAAPPDRVPAIAPVAGVVDSDPFREAIDMRLNQVSIAARTKGRAVAAVTARPLSLARLMAWINDLEGQGLVLTPASAVVVPPPAPGKS
ncbi:divergent polysaccharide deacetylase family protein [Magnetospirillum sp. SS-4]|uniref:divergent polysaccharide deacetylase family protein n=1 Tax=Magnetospirillum sp. SS-4 TaxID=2681465 RepID=UPI001384C63F|nr:divergent polysaccharide deacetylase family protein [Magnetospirillum sp. SS-4]CAA7617744.1 Skin secretory protein xP2 [Magnetospirillum sp. SS-4]